MFEDASLFFPSHLLTDLSFFFLLTGRERDGLAGSASCEDWTAISAYLQVYFILHDYVYEPQCKDDAPVGEARTCQACSRV